MADGGDLHAISEAIGALRAAHAAMLQTQHERWNETQRQHQTLWTEMKEMNAALRPVAALTVSIVEDLSSLKPIVDDWRMTKQRAMGIVAALSIVSAMIGFLARALGAWISKMIGG